MDGEGGGDGGGKKERRGEIDFVCFLNFTKKHYVNKVIPGFITPQILAFKITGYTY